MWMKKKLSFFFFLSLNWDDFNPPDEQHSCRQAGAALHFPLSGFYTFAKSQA